MSATNWSFYYFFPCLDSCMSFSCSTVLVRTSSNRKVEVRVESLVHLFLRLKGKVFSFQHLGWYELWICHIQLLLSYVPSIPKISRAFMDVKLSQMLPQRLSIWSYVRFCFFLFFFFDVLNYVNFQMLNHPIFLG